MLKKIVLPQGLKVVGGFHSCPNLTEVVLPEGIEKIAARAFCGCDSIRHIKIPSSVEIMSGDCFAGCNIESYEVAEDNPYFTAVDGAIFTKDLTTLVAFPSAYPHNNYIVPEKTRRIGNGAFLYSKMSRSNVGESAIKELVVRGEYLVFHQPSNGKGPSTWHRHKGFYWFLTKSITASCTDFQKRPL